MNRAERMLEVLRDGRPHTRREIFERAGFMLTNNAASELRAKDYDVRQSSESVEGQIVYSYQLFGSLREGESATCQAVSPSRSDAAPEPSSVAGPSGPATPRQLAMDGLHRGETEAA